MRDKSSSTNVEITGEIPSDLIGQEVQDVARDIPFMQYLKARFSKRQGSRAKVRTMGRRQSTVSYSTRVSGAFVLTAMMTVLIMVGVLAVVWEGQFQSYTRDNLQTIAKRTATSIAESYDEYGQWTTGVTNAALAVSNISGGIGIQVLDQEDNIIMDSTWVSTVDGMPIEISLAPPGTHMVQAPIVSENTRVKVGTVRVWAMGSEVYLTQNDIVFRDNSYRAIAIATIVAVVLALILGLVFARTLVSPVRRITDTANSIKDGDLEARTGLTGDDEIAQLGETFDAMAQSIENDRALERRLTTDVAHELRTPLMSVLATVEAMQDGVLPADPDHLALVASETKRLSRLVDALLELSRLESGSIPFDFQDVDMVELIQGIAMTHEMLINDAGLELLFINETGRRSVKAEVDPNRLHQAIINLISNAVRYTDEGGTIEISVGVEHNRRYVYIAVSDTGMGISEEDLDRVFSRFWRAEESRTRASGGLGVGLAVTKEVIDRHHGYIEVESELGKGTRFSLHIPRNHKPAQNVRTSDKDNASDLL